MVWSGPPRGTKTMTRTTRFFLIADRLVSILILSMGATLSLATLTV